MALQIGISIPNFRGAATLGTFKAVARAAEDSGFDDVWVGDHVGLPRMLASYHPYSREPSKGEKVPWSEGGIRDMDCSEPVWDPLAVVPFLAGITTRIRLAIGTLVVPLRNPVVTAKQLATIDALCQGRLLLGVGVGWIQEEYEAVGADWSMRGSVTDEYLEIMQLIWTDDNPSYEGQHYQLSPGMWFEPKPVGRHIPIWVGGNSRAALRRVARLGDGWHGAFLTPTQVESRTRQLQEEMEARGRSLEELELSMRVNLRIGSQDDPDHGCVGPAAKVIESLHEYRDAGISHIQFATPPGPTTDVILRQIAAFSESVWPAL